MTIFNVRIQLPGSPAAEVYERLHVAMKAEGFEREITLDDEKLYRLPHGEYIYVTSGTPIFGFDDVWEKACRGAATVSPNATVRLSETSHSMFANLEEVVTAPAVPLLKMPPFRRR
jgi:hypothetical protein